MIHSTKGKMFLADERGQNETKGFRSFNTFNFGKYNNEHKHAFGDIYVVNDDTLDGGRSLRMMIEEESYIILLPVVGAIAYKDTAGNENIIAAGQVQILACNKGVAMEIRNPFKEELVNFLQIWIKADKQPAGKTSLLSSFDVNEFLNCLVKIPPHGPVLPFTISIGKFKGRGETTYQMKNKNSGVFIFVIEGAFEVDGRLLHARDGLGLWQLSEAEFEALSNDAIVLVVEDHINF
jgi:quercetin 2,3-dioxygenase